VSVPPQESSSPTPPGSGESPSALRIDLPAERSETASTVPAEEARHKRDIEKSKLDHDQRKELGELRRQTIAQSVGLALPSAASG